MEEVWAVYLCLILFVIVYFLMKRKPEDEIMREREASLASRSFSSGRVGKDLECSEEELDASLRRLSGVLLGTELLKREPHPENRTSSYQEKAPHHATHEGHVDEIDQGVQEAVATDVHVRKRPQQPQQPEPNVQL